MIGVDQSSLTPPVSPALITNQSTIRSAKALARPTVQLPTIESVILPPVPVKKTSLKEPNFAASHIIVIDRSTRLPLYIKAANQQIAIASTTKIMTALVALEKYPDLNRRVEISQTAQNQIGSVVAFRPGETATIDQLLHGLLIVSGNDVALALSEQLTPIGGADSTTAFVAEMNKLARRIGMNNSLFVDPAGLNDQGYSTAADMAKAMLELLNKPELVNIIRIGNFEYNSPEGYPHIFKSSNRLVTEGMLYPGIIGGKTGYTPKTVEGGAGHCLVVAAEREGHQLVAAIFDTYSNTPQASAEVAKALFDYSWQNFTWQSVKR